MNLFEVIHDAFKPFLDGEKPPLNVMEVTNLWAYLAGTDNTVRNEEVAYNIIQDKELKQLFKDSKSSIHEPIQKQISEFLLKEGIPLPKSTPEKPSGEFNSIPEGAKLNDEELANLMSFNLLTGVNYAARGLTESIRADVGLMFVTFLVRKVTLGLTLKDLMERRGWLRKPPHYNPSQLKQ